MKIKWDSKLLISASVLLCSSICLSLAVLSHVFTSYQYEANNEISENWFPSVDAIGKIRVTLYQLRRIEAHAAMSANDCSGGCTSPNSSAKQLVLAAEAVYKPLVTAGAEQSLFSRYLAQRQAYMESEEIVFQSSQQQDKASERFLSESQLAFDSAMETLNQLSDFNSKEGLKAHRVALTNHDRAILCIDILNMLLLLMAGGMVFALYKYTSRENH